MPWPLAADSLSYKVLCTAQLTLQCSVELYTLFHAFGETVYDAPPPQMRSPTATPRSGRTDISLTRPFPFFIQSTWEQAVIAQNSTERPYGRGSVRRTMLRNLHGVIDDRSQGIYDCE